MSIPLLESAFIAGEISASVAGRFDVAKIHVAAFTMRNFFVSYRGGAFSRAGTAFVGFSRQTGRSYPPRMVPFQFSINQGLALEFGNLYMRVISDGAFVTHSPLAITNATQANPCVITAAPIESGNSASSIISSVSASYVVGEVVSLAGGTFTTRAKVTVQNTSIASLAVNSGGTGGYVQGDTISPAGGVFTVRPLLTVQTTQVVSVTLSGAGNGGTPGTQTLTGTTGTGTKFQISVQVSAGGHVTSINSITVSGNYTVNPSNLIYEPTTGGGFGTSFGQYPVFAITMGVKSVAISNPGSFTTNSSTLTQFATSGSGVGATFNTVVYGPNEVTFSTPGAYTVLPANPVAQSSTTGSGAGATFNVTWNSPTFPVNGDWVAIASVGGMTQLNGQTGVVAGVSGSTFHLQDVYGNAIDSSAFTAYTVGGFASVIYTLATPYSETDLEYLKWTQSADVMSICCVNQQTGTEYAPLDLSRTADDNWSFNDVIPAPSVLPPTSLAGSASTSGSVDYNYVVTAIDPNNGTESVASPIADIPSAVDIAVTAGSITLTWAQSPTPGVNDYYLYKATPAYSGTVPVGAQFGFVGSAAGTQFVDSNIVADMAQVPPLHKNPFARGQILSVSITNPGSGASFTYSITSATGSGAVLAPVAVSNSLVAVIVLDPGQNYLPTDTITFNNGATGTLNIGPQSGTYPAVPAYFQERRAYANTINNPDTYFMSQPGAFTNFDTRSPPIDPDAFTGSPWAVEVNGIQWMEQTSGGLLVLTGLSAWLLVGAGSFATNVQAISPSTQDAVPQAFSGCSATVPPIRINYDVIYVNSKGSYYFDLPYQLYALSEPIDLTEYSSQLFVGYTIREHAWCEQPYKVLWAVRSDGALLSLTYYKTQQVAGWARHDTNGLFQSVCSVVEPPVDALYCATQRYPGTNTAYMIERMDNRIWQTEEDPWCVDCALALPQPTPDATLSVSSPTGLGAVTGATGLVGGAGYSAGTTGTVVDANVGNGPGPGAGAVPTLTIVAGVITAVTFSGGNQGSGYLNPQLVLADPANTGSDASAVLTLNNSATFSTDVAAFAVGDVGSVIRTGGGKAVITAYTNSQHVTANIITPIVAIVPNSTGPKVVPAAPGDWTLTAPVTTITGLNHLAGATVTGLADGNVIPATTVSAAGSITLSTAASDIRIGLGFQAQLQSVFLDGGEPTVQGQRKKIAAVTVRLEASRGFKIGTNMPDGSRLNPAQIQPTWYYGQGGLTDATVKSVPPYNSTVQPLYTGDIRIPVAGGWDTRGQIAIQQDNPLPVQCLAFVPEVYGGDTPQVQAQKRQERGR